MPTQYTLTYFGGQGRAETIRLLFHAAGVKFEDVRIQKEQWGQLRPTTPLGKLPVLETEGVAIAQSGAITRYVAFVVGLAGNTPIERALIDMWCAEIDDLLAHVSAVMMEKDESRKAKLIESTKENFDVCLAKFEAHLSEKKFMIGGQLSVADIKILSTFTAPVVERIVGSKALEKFPNVNSLVQRVSEIPNIKSYLMVRPETQF